MDELDVVPPSVFEGFDTITPRLPSCPIETTLVRPQLDRLARDVNAAHVRLRDHGSIIEKLLLWRDESSRRIGMLEHSAAERNQAVNDLTLVVESLEVRVNGEFSTIKDRLDRVNGGVDVLINRFDRHANDMKEASLESTRKAEVATEKHEKSMRRALTLAYSIAALVAVLLAIHGAVTGVPIVEYIRGFLS